MRREAVVELSQYVSDFFFFVPPAVELHEREEDQFASLPFVVRLNYIQYKCRQLHLALT